MIEISLRAGKMASGPLSAAAYIWVSLFAKRRGLNAKSDIFE